MKGKVAEQVRRTTKRKVEVKKTKKKRYLLTVTQTSSGKLCNSPVTVVALIKT